MTAVSIIKDSMQFLSVRKETILKELNIHSQISTEQVVGARHMRF